MLDLGALVARVLFDDAEFQTGYTRVVRQMGELGVAGEKAASGTAVLDRELAATGKAGTSAAAGIDRATRSTTAAAPADDKAAAAASRHAAAVARVAAIMDDQAAASPKVQQATLRVAAAQERLNAVQESGVATARQLELAQANLIGAQRSLSAAMAETEVAAGGMRAGLAGAAKTAGQLGLLIGGIEIAKKAIEFISAGKDLTDALNMVQAAARATDTQMVAVRAQAIALGKDLTIPGATAVDAANAILELVKAGIALPRAMEAARPALLLAAATNSKMADTAKVLGDTMDIFSIKGAGAAHAANIIGASVLGASHDLLGFFDAMKQAGPTAQAMKISLDDVSTVITYLAKHGLSTSMGGAGIKTFLTNLTKDVPKATAALKDLGVEAFDAQGRFVGFPKVFDQLHAAYVRFGPDSERFLKDLNAAFGVRSQSAAAIFGKVTGQALDEVHHKLETGDLQKFADTMNRGPAAAMRQLGKEATSAGIAVEQKLEGPFTDAADTIGKDLPVAVSTLAKILGPTIHLVGDGLGGAFHLVGMVLGPVLHLLGDVGHVLAEHQGAVTAVATAVLAMWAAYKGFVIARAALQAVGVAVIMLRGRAEALTAQMRMMSASSFAMGTAMFGLGAIVAAVTERHQEQAAQLAANQAAEDALTSAIEADSGALGENTRKQVENDLVAKNAYQTALKMGISQKLLTDAVLGNKAAYAELLDRMHAYEAQSGHNSKAVFDLTGALAEEGIVVQIGIRNAKDKAAADGKTTKTIGETTAAIQAQTRTTTIANTTQQEYARMLGIVVDQNGKAYASHLQVARAISIVQDAYDHATPTLTTFLDAEDAFSKSAATSADRAALIGATLKAANGDALAFAGSMASSTSAIDQFVQSVVQERQQLAQQSADQSSAAERVRVAQLRLNEMRDKGKHSAAELASAEKSLSDAQAAAAKSGSLSYEDTMRAAIRFRQTQDGLKASIDTTAKGAPNLVSALQAIQDAAVQASSAIYQHEGANKKAADDAYNLYVTKTRGALIDNRKQLGLNLGEARALAKAYFGLDGKKVKTLIEAEGTNPIVKVLDKIGRLLANITGQQWNVKVRYSTTGATPSANAAEHDAGIAPPPAPPHGTPQHRAAGGPIVAGVPYIVHDSNRPELFVSRQSGYMYPDASKLGNGTQEKHIHLHGDLVLNVQYPDHERTSEMLPRALRMAGEQLESYL